MKIRESLEIKDRLIVSLDVSSRHEIDKVCKEIANKISTIKIGLEVIYSQGLDIIDVIKGYGYKVMLDAKLMDIPNTVKKALKAILLRDVFAVTLHILGGKEMLESSKAYIEEVAGSNFRSMPLMFGVSVLTSLEDSDLSDLGFKYDHSQTVERLASIAISSGIDGIICSPNEAGLIRDKLSRSFLIATPGIRLKEDKRSDQKRVNTPEYSIKQGADIIIVGRPIIQSEDISSKIDQFLKKIKECTEK